MNHQGDSRFCREMRQLEVEQVRIKAFHRDMFECYQPGDKAALETMRWLVQHIRELGQRMESLVSIACSRFSRLEAGVAMPESWPIQNLHLSICLVYTET